MSTAPSTLRLQDASRDTAIRHRSQRTTGDWDTIEDTLEDPAVEVARRVQRTYYAVLSHRRDVRRGVRRAVRVAASDRAYRGWVEGMGEE